MNQSQKKLAFLGIGGLILLIILMKSYIVVPPGHVSVATLFGEVQQDFRSEGFHLVNPLLKWHEFDTRQKTLKESAPIPSQDQLRTQLEVSIQYRFIKEAAPRVLQETGNAQQAINVHLVPKLRSILREQGKTIKRAEDFFLEKTQENLQTALLSGLQEYLSPKGIEVQAVLIRDIVLPDFIIKAIESKKEREQAVERQKAELARFRTEQEQKVAQAEAEKAAAKAQAEKKRLLADAQAYEIMKINEAIASNPTYLQLKAMDALKSIATDPAAKIYFLNGDSPNPLPLMHIGEQTK